MKNETIKGMIEEGFSAQDIAQLIIETTQDLLLTDSHGMHIPKIACEQFDIKCQKEDKDTCLAGPDEDWYWDAWQSICDFGTLNGKSLYQNGDLWIVDYKKRAELIEEAESSGIDVESEVESLLCY